MSYIWAVESRFGVERQFYHRKRKKMVDKRRRIRYYAVITMAEVAEFISTGSVWQLPKREREFRRRAYPVPNGATLGLRKTCAELSSEGMEC